MVMGLTKSFRRKVTTVRIREAAALLLRRAGWVLTLAGVIAIFGVSVERLLALHVLTSIAVGLFAAATGAFIIIPWLLRIPTPMQASVLLDERLGLKERFSTTLAMVQSNDPFAQAARTESLQAIERVDLRGHFPIRLTGHWLCGAGVWLTAVLLIFFLPQKDLLGVLRQRQEQDVKARQVAEVKDEVRKALEPVRSAVQKLGDPNLSEELAKLDKIMQLTDPQEIKREAMKALGDLSDKIKKMQEAPQAQIADELKQAFKRLKGSTDPFSQEIRSALAKGDAGKAAEMLGQLQKQMSEGSLPSEKQKELARQLQDLAGELKRLSQQQTKQLEDELAKLGLDKGLAKLSSEQLKQALQKQGLSQEAIDKLLQKAAASQAAQGQLAKLAQSLGGAAADGMLLGDNLGEAIDQLNAVDAMEKQGLLLASSEGALANFGMGSKGLGQGAPDGPPNPFGIGTETTDNRAPDADDPTATKTTRAASKTGEGPVVAGWYFKDTQVKGESRRGFTDVVQAGRTGAAEAISENQIPRRHEQMIKQYFNQLEASGPKP
jgi:hypothetical protein